MPAHARDRSPGRPPAKAAPAPKAAARNTARPQPTKPVEKPPKPLTQKDVHRKLKRVVPGFKATEAAPEVPTLALMTQLRDPDPKQRVAALQALAERDAKEAAGAIAPLLHEGPKTVRSAAALALLRLGDAALFAEMLGHIKDPDPAIAAGAATALGMSRRPDALQALLDRGSQADASLLASIIPALGQLGQSGAVDFLLARVSDEALAPLACEALGRIGEARASKPLLAALASPNPAVKIAAARAIAALEGRTKTFEKLAASTLRKLLDAPEQRVRFSAALALYELKDKGAPERLLEVLRGA